MVSGVRIQQTLSRIGAGLSSMGALVWLLWPDDLIAFWDPEPLFVFLVGLVVWIATEFKLSEEAQNWDPSESDRRICGELINLHRHQLRTILKDDDLFQFHDSEIFTLCGTLLNRREIGELEFSDQSLDEKLGSFILSLNEFYGFIAQHTTPEFVAGRMMTGFKPLRTVPQQEYDRRLSLSREANKLASATWDDFEVLIKALKLRIPDRLE